MKKGFTLIELLVVVLIIGILAAIAVPQYTKAVEKSRTAEALLNLKNVSDALNRFFLQHGSYYTSGTTLPTFDDFDIELSNSRNYNFTLGTGTGTYAGMVYVQAQRGSWDSTHTTFTAATGANQSSKILYYLNEGGLDSRTCEDADSGKLCKGFGATKSCSGNICKFD